jgi:Domain of unknown function (DUF4326)
MTDGTAGGGPVRIQLSRRPGSRLPPGARSAARPGKFGNRFVIDKPVGRRDVLRPYLDAAVLEITSVDAGLAVPAYDAITPGTPAVAAAAFRLWLRDRPELKAAARAELRGRDLACWCNIPAPGEPDTCHAQVLLAVANDAGDQVGDAASRTLKEHEL